MKGKASSARCSVVINRTLGSFVESSQDLKNFVLSSRDSHSSLRLEFEASLSLASCSIRANSSADGSSSPFFFLSAAAAGFFVFSSASFFSSSVSSRGIALPPFKWAPAILNS